MLPASCTVGKKGAAEPCKIKQALRVAMNSDNYTQKIHQQA